MKPAPPMMMNAISQPQSFASGGIVSGAASAPTDAPELKMEVANARSFFGKYSAVTLMAAGKLPASPSASTARHARKSHTETPAIAAAVALPAWTARSASTELTSFTNQQVARPHAAWRHAPSDHTKMAHR